MSQEYTVVTRRGFEPEIDLNEAVEAYMANGWKLVGGVAYGSHPTNQNMRVVSQAMTRKGGAKPVKKERKDKK